MVDLYGRPCCISVGHQVDLNNWSWIIINQEFIVIELWSLYRIINHYDIITLFSVLQPLWPRSLHYVLRSLMVDCITVDINWYCIIIINIKKYFLNLFGFLSLSNEANWNWCLHDQYQESGIGNCLYIASI